ncbi:MAG TPA: phosphoribosylformylglycinamidine synthase subunit PurL [Candidatus Limnocylindria bacterium]|nr:phosphoribosylformylglycinamidine synthase subunit PurL [Candidatus Limnocylindria bacterium]
MSVAAETLAYRAEDARDPVAVSRRLAEQGVTLEPDEVTLLLELLGRPPRWAEAVLFGILWSEHCSYKSTRHLLRRLPTQAPQVLIGPGEDAGVVALPAPCEDLALVLAHESHNHPSQVLPVEGAATGVGGIVRDVGCMGAEVVGVLDGLRFGHPVEDGVRARDIVRGVVQGIADYGNALGVPNLGGDVYFDRGFGEHCLVNVMSVGVVPRSGVLRSRVPEGPGPWVFVLIGKPTDESGFGGAAFASAELSGDQRGAVQLPDPFLKRVLHVANAELFERLRARGLPAGFKDLGAGGVACATSELAAAGGCGAEIALDQVPRVTRPVPPEVLLCAETQERYCWVLPESFAAEACELYNREFALGDIVPGAGARVIGRAIAPAVYRVTWHGEPLVDCPVEAITTGRKIERLAHRRPPAPPLRVRKAAPDVRGALLAVIGGWNGCSREYLFRHYDSEVQGRTWLRPGEGDASVIRLDRTRSLGIALALGGNPYWCASDPELGARHAVAEAARNVACAGGRPWALTDCLNFGHPESPEVMGDLTATLEGLAVAAEALGGLAAAGHPLPFVSGNVSLYNQTGARAIPASPIVLCAGVLRDLTVAVGLGLQRAGDFLVLVGEPRGEMTGSAYAREVLGEHGFGPPTLDLAREARLHELAVLAAEGRWVRAAHDVSDGGLGLALAEMLLGAAPDAPLGAQVDLGVLETEPTAALFSERSAIVFEVAPERAPALFQAARARSLLAWPIGTVWSQPELKALQPDGVTLRWSRDELAAAAERPLRALWNEEDA